MKQRIAYECEAGCSAENHKNRLWPPSPVELSRVREHHAGQHGSPGLFVGGIPESTLCVLHEEMGKEKPDRPMGMSQNA